MKTEFINRDLTLSAVLLFLIAIMTACAPTVNETPLPMDHDAVDKVYSDFAIAYRKADVRMVEEIYADTAIYLNPGDNLQFGRKNFMSSFQQMYGDAIKEKAQLSIEFKIVKRTPAGEGKVIDVGYYHFTREKEGEETIESVGKFMTVLQRQEDGSYKFIIDGFNQAPLSAWR